MPATARSSLVHYLSTLSSFSNQSADGWTDRSQATIASRMGKNARTVRRYERVCEDMGLIEVQHHGRHNRRKLRAREAKELAKLALVVELPTLRGWTSRFPQRGHACPHSEDTRVPTPNKRSARAALRTSLKNPPTPRRGDVARASLASSSAASSSHKAERASLADQATARATMDAVRALEIGKRWWVEAAELVRERVRHEGHVKTREYLAWMRSKLERVIDPRERGRRSLGMLRAGVAKLDERHGKREGRRELAAAR